MQDEICHAELRSLLFGGLAVKVIPSVLILVHSPLALTGLSDPL